MADADKAENNREDLHKQGSLRSRFGHPHPAWLAFAIAALVSGVFIAIDARGTLPSGDEWDYFHRLATQPLPEALFDAPPNKYLLAVPLFTIYLPHAEIFGIGEALPLRIAGIGLVIVVAGLSLELLRRRAGYPFGLAAAVLLLFLGAAGEVVATPQRIPGLMAACFGLGMLLALDRQDRRGDVIAAACGVLGIASHPVMLPFLAGAGVRLLFGNRNRIQRFALVLVPSLALFGAWRVLVYERTQVSEQSFQGVIEFAGDHFVALIASITGLFRGPFVDGTDFINGISVAASIAAAAALAFVLVRRRGLTLGLGAALVMLAVTLIAPSVGPSALFTSPVEPRYLHPGAVILLIFLAELVAAGKPWPRRSGFLVAAGALVWLTLALPMNVAELHKRADVAATSGDLIRAEFGALELARTVPGSFAEDADAAEPTRQEIEALAFSGEFGEASSGLVVGAAPTYFDIAAQYGTPALDAETLSTTRPELRADADAVFIAASSVAAVPAAAPPTSLEAEAPNAEQLGSKETEVAAGTCASVPEPREAVIPEPAPPPEGAGEPLTPVKVPSGEVWLEGENLQGLRVGRFAVTALRPILVASGQDVTLALPLAGAEFQPWRLQLYGMGPVTICVV